MNWSPLSRQSSSDNPNALRTERPVVSIIIPVLNEEHNIAQRLYELVSLADCEVIVVDGGSSDRTREIVESYAGHSPDVRLRMSASGRSIQMNTGAHGARGEFLLFLHADTMLPLATYHHFHHIASSDSDLAAGAFAFQVDGVGLWYRWLEKSVGWRNRRMRLPFGDQGIFVRRELFAAMGGYREDYPLMEDLDLARRLKKIHGFRILHDHPVLTSGRRWDQEGRLYTSLRNVCLQILFSLGVHPRRLAQFYWKGENRS